MCNLQVEIAKKKKKLRGIKNEIAKTGKSLDRETNQKGELDLEKIQEITTKLHQLTEKSDRLEADITEMENNRSDNQPELSPA